MFELDEYGYMVPVFLSEDHNDTDWFETFDFVVELSLSVFDPCEYCECEDAESDAYADNAEYDDPF